MQQSPDNFLSFIATNPREDKPSKTGLTEIRAAYYTPFGKRYLEDLLETMGRYIDSIKFAGGAFILQPTETLETIIDLAHMHSVLVSTGGFIEYVLTQGLDTVKKYIRNCKTAGFDIIEISSGFITLSKDDWLRLMGMVQEAGLKAKPEVSIQFGAGGASDAASLKAAGRRDPGQAVEWAREFIAEGAYLVMIESEGITEHTDPWQTDIPARFIAELGMEKLMFEAADPAVFDWYIRNYGYKVNLFTDHSQIVQLECLRSGIWGTQQTWGRIQGLKNYQ
jgi:phosphosulfolactate synthase (CoM biosynthesis protein A)